MTKARKIFMWGVSGAGILLVLLAALALLLPHVLDTDAIGRNLAAELEARYHIRSERIKISFLPFPAHGHVRRQNDHSGDTHRIGRGGAPSSEDTAPAYRQIRACRNRASESDDHRQAAGADARKLGKVLFSAASAPERQDFPVPGDTFCGNARRGYRRSQRRAGTLLRAKPRLLFRRDRPQDFRSCPKGRFRADERQIRSLASPYIQRLGRPRHSEEFSES